MARNNGSNLGIWLIGGLVLLIAMCNGGGNDTSSSTAPPPSVTEEIATPPPSELETLYVGANALNQRSSPNGSIVGKLSGGDSVSVHERNGTWVRVSPDGASPLWVSSSLLCSGSDCYKPSTTRNRSYNPPSKRSRSNYSDDTCPCSGSRICIGPRGGRYCITSGGNKRYGV